MSGSWRTTPLPANWTALRRQVLERDGGVCQWLVGPSLCGAPANQVDHVIPSGPDAMSNLQALCSFHHQQKSASEGQAALRAKRKEIMERLRKPPERHPGMP